jgi:CDP-glucose 4,6-dehydratase
MFHNTFYKKKILITGHTGFKGSWLFIWLSLMGADLYGISLKPKKNKNILFFCFKKKIKNFFFDISNEIKTKSLIKKIKPDFIFHLAAQAIVSQSYKYPLLNWKTNLFGTINLLESVKNFKQKCVIIIVTSDKCYEVNEKKEQIFVEQAKLGGKDPYSASKACVEILTKSYYDSFFKNNKNISIATVRAGNVIGGGDFSKDRIVPDCMKSWSLKKYAIIRNPNHIRPWQHVLDALSGYLLLATKLNKSKKINGEAFNFGPSEKKLINVSNLVKKLGLFWKKPLIKKNNRNLRKKILETSVLQLDSTKSKKILKWEITLDPYIMISMTSNWYKKYYENKNLIVNFSLDQISFFVKTAVLKKNNWIK